MKKAMKLVWAVLMMLPMVAITSCEDDPKEEDLFADYSVLIGKSRQQAIDYVGAQPIDDGADYQTFRINSEGIISVDALYSYQDGVVLDKCVIVESYLNSYLTANSVNNFLLTKYTYEGTDEDGWYVYTSKDRQVYYIPEDNSVMYIDTKNMPKAFSIDDVVTFIKARKG